MEDPRLRAALSGQYMQAEEWGYVDPVEVQDGGTQAGKLFLTQAAEGPPNDAIV